jgi:hypothetical protein
MFVLEVIIDGRAKYLAKNAILVDHVDSADWFDSRWLAWQAGAAYIDSDGFPDEVQSIRVVEV